MNSQRELEKLIAVGRRVLLHIGSGRTDGARHKSIIRGWQKASYIILSVPVEDGVPLITRRDQPCVVRFMHEGMACGFEARILDPGTRQSAYFQISWPDDVKMIVVRKHERVDMRAPCTVEPVGEGQLEGTAVDISLGGCGILLDRKLPLRKELTLDVILPNGVHLEEIPCVVSKVHPAGGNIFIGCEFQHPPEYLENDIYFFVANAFERQRGHLDPTVQILLVDRQPSRTAKLCKAIEQRGIESSVVPGVVDAFYRLRVAPPGALMISQDQTDLDPLETCRILRATKGCESTPVFVYRAKDDRLSGQAKSAGLTGVFAASQSPGDIADRVTDMLKQSEKAVAGR